MDDTIDIPVVYKGEDYNFNARVVGFGYTYRLEVQLNDKFVILEPDEERNYRAVSDPSKDHNFSADEIALMSEIIKVLDAAK